MAEREPECSVIQTWTYAGVLDDMVQRFPWTPNRLDGILLDLQIAYSIVTGRPLLVNDGYLVLNDSCLRALRREQSPLRVALRNGGLKILSRNPDKSLEQMVLQGARQGIGTYMSLVESESWSSVQEALSRTDEELEGVECFVGWPRIDLTGSFRLLLADLASRPHVERGLDKVSESDFNNVHHRFQDAMEKVPSKPRSQFEEIVMHKVASSSSRNQLMQMANEIYHHNFGAALVTRPPAEFAGGADVAVYGRTSSCFQSLYADYQPVSFPRKGEIPNISLPKGGNYSSGNQLLALLHPGEPIAKRRQHYLATRRDWLEGRCTIEALQDATYVYQNQLNAYFLEGRRPKEVTEHILSACVTVGSVGLTLGNASKATSITVGILAHLATELIFPSLIEKLKIDAAIAEFLAAFSDRPSSWEDAVTGRGVLASLTINTETATELLRDLPAFAG